MNKRLLRKGLFLVFVVGGFCVGYVVAHNREFSAGMERSRVETAGNIALRVQALSLLRTGDIDGAIESIEQSVDRGICTLPMLQDYAEMPNGSQRSLMVAKIYRTAFPPKSADVAATLAPVPLISADHNCCSAALAKIARIAHERQSPSVKTEGLNGDE